MDQYKSPIAFLYSYQNSGLEIFENLKINKIKKYDQENSADYMNTLRAYLLCNRDYNKMAEKLHIHRNTVFYRMNRIAELFDLDLSDCRVIAGLYLSLFIE
ncbi:hypothetical protein SDC9_182590 [bioreactor metagenome]|uniref:PucR C-terminal helix-turn-helix domain-containing protein n=1 Tax=bioreactor metagenome TaxID=1076179 RepID=A0A645H7Y2_9ZZZZ